MDQIDEQITISQKPILRADPLKPPEQDLSYRKLPDIRDYI